eukprot:193302-Pleurochrysis_carterae.AAC.7
MHGTQIESSMLHARTTRAMSQSAPSHRCNCMNRANAARLHAVHGLRVKQTRALHKLPVALQSSIICANVLGPQVDAKIAWRVCEASMNEARSRARNGVHRGRNGCTKFARRAATKRRNAIAP